MNPEKKKSPIVKLLSYSAPLCANGLLNILSNVIAMLFVAQLGKVELSASALAYTSFMTIMTVTTTCLYAVSILCSHCYANKEYEEIGAIARNGFWVALILGIPGSFLLWNMESILSVFGQDLNLIKLTVLYFHYSALLLVPSLLIMVMTQLYIGIGKPRIGFIGAIIRMPFLIVLSYGYILGKFGLPKLGLAGASYSTFIVRSIFLIGLFVYMINDKSIRKYALLSTRSLVDWVVCKKIFKIGLPIGLQFGGELGAITVATYFMGFFGVAALAATQIILQYSMLAITIIIGVSQAVSVLISNAYGKKDYKLIEKYKRLSIKTIAVFSLIIIGLFLLAPKLLMMPYISIYEPSNSYLVSLTAALFAVAGITLSIDAVRNVISAILRGLHESKTPMIIGIACLWAISLPICYLFGVTFNGGPIWLRIGFASGFLVAVLILWMQLLKKQSFLEHYN